MTSKRPRNVSQPTTGFRKAVIGGSHKTARRNTFIACSHQAFLAMNSHPPLRLVASLAAILVALASFLCACPAQAEETSRPLKENADDMLKIGVPEQTQSTKGKRNGESKLPRVLLLGDSISGGYAGQVNLNGKALTVRCGNGGPTTVGVKYLDEVLQQLGDEPWDLIHFNWGLHDMTFQTRMAPEERGIDQYAARLEQLVVRLKKTGAKLIWATTTPWCPEPYEYAATRLKVKLQYSAEEEKQWKDAALNVMKKHDIPVNDLHALLLPNLNDYLNKPDDIHFNRKGDVAMGRKIADVIGECLQLDLGEGTPADPASIKDIKAYCLDFNWAGKSPAPPGLWKDADPAQHVAWYKAMGANVIQTFCVSINGYAWYKNGFVPEQPGLKHDFLTEVVKLGHKEGMLVFGYYCIALNKKWGTDHPELSYDLDTAYHIPYTDEYLAYLSASIADAVTKTGIDGFMMDWLWMPTRKSQKNAAGKWLDCEKKLYQQLMGEPFPGEDKLGAKDLAYSRKAIDRCWKAIRAAAKKANPKCILWLTSNSINHPHVNGSDMYKETDWLMNESGDMAGIDAVRAMVGKHTRLITCLARWNGQDASVVIPAALAAGVGLYGFTAPRDGVGLVPLDGIFPHQVGGLNGDDRSIAMLARAYQGKSIEAIWANGVFVEPAVPAPFQIRIEQGGRGPQNSARVLFEKASAVVTVHSIIAKGRAQLTRRGEHWPDSLVIRFSWPVYVGGPSSFRMASNAVGFQVSLNDPHKVSSQKMEGRLDLDRLKVAVDKAGDTSLKVVVTRTKQTVDIQIPAELTAGNPEVIAFEWN